MTLTSDQVEELMAWARNQAPGRRLRYELFASESYGWNPAGEPAETVMFRAYLTDPEYADNLLVQMRLL